MTGQSILVHGLSIVSATSTYASVAEVAKRLKRIEVLDWQVTHWRALRDDGKTPYSFNSWIELGLPVGRVAVRANKKPKPRRRVHNNRPKQR